MRYTIQHRRVSDNLSSYPSGIHVEQNDVVCSDVVCWRAAGLSTGLRHQWSNGTMTHRIEKYETKV